MLYEQLTGAALLKYAAGRANLTPDDIVGKQLILVTACGSSADLRCYEKADAAQWRPHEALGVIAGFVGRNGVTASKKEGDGCTPAGLFGLGHIFGIHENPETKMAYRMITPSSFWVDDPASRYYNMWVEGLSCGGRFSAERLSDYPREYAYAIVIEYNTAERLPGKGSAVFLHCGDNPTSGCIAVPEPALLRILKWLDPEKSPGILITDVL